MVLFLDVSGSFGDNIADFLMQELQNHNELYDLDSIPLSSNNSDIFFDAFDTISGFYSSSDVCVHSSDAIADESGAPNSSIDLYNKHRDNSSAPSSVACILRRKPSSQFALRKLPYEQRGTLEIGSFHRALADELHEISHKIAADNANLDELDSSLDLSTSDSRAFDKGCYSDSKPYFQSDEHVSEIASIDLQQRFWTDFLIKIALLAAKIVGFQVSICIGFFTFPLSVLYYSYIFATDPFRLMGMIVGSVMSFSSKIADLIVKITGPAMGRCWEEYMSMLRMVLKIGWALFWLAYVALILGVLLVLSVVMSSMVMRMVLEEPLHKEEALHFDYTQSSPVAFAQLTSFPSSSCVAASSWVNNGPSKSGKEERVIPPHRRFMITLSLTLPESDYNRDLGIFQVTVEAMSMDNKVLASSTHPCIFPFSSNPVRLLSTFFNLLPLLTGYRSESHTLKIKLRDFVEGDTPTSFFRVALQKRAAAFRPGAGIPEIYAARLLLDSSLPFLKRTLWSWKTTVFIWTTMAFFSTQILFLLSCSTSTLFPKSSL